MCVYISGISVRLQESYRATEYKMSGGKYLQLERIKCDAIFRQKMDSKPPNQTHQNK